MKRYLKLAVVFCSLICTSCRKEETPFEAQDGLHATLSEYGVYTQPMAELRPAVGFLVYELATPLFTDHAEKQRLLKLPAGTLLKAKGSGLPDFPEGTILIKTFFYHTDKRTPEAGKKIIETRILLKKNGAWNVGTYVWNKEQTEATLFDAGLNETVNWTDEQGKARVVAYHIPNRASCKTCHQVSGNIMPLGPKLRNLNRLVQRGNGPVNQLGYLHQAGVLESLDPAQFMALPDWENESLSLEERSRAYLDVNCAHCHNSAGSAAGTNFYMNYELATEETRITQRGNIILQRIENKEMPRLGTGVIDAKGLALLKAYLGKTK